MQFVILKDDYKVDEYGIEIKRENPPEFKDLKPASYQRICDNGRIRCGRQTRRG